MFIVFVGTIIIDQQRGITKEKKAEIRKEILYNKKVMKILK